MAATVIVRRYAEAYFALAADAGAIDEWREELSRAVETLSNAEIRSALANPRLSLAERVHLAADLLDGSSTEVRALVRLLIERGRVGIAADLLGEYDRLADRSRGIVNVEIITAVPLKDGLRDEIVAAVTGQVDGTIRATVRHDPSIIGGTVIRIDDRVIDDSVRTHLQQLQAALA